jgi:FAD:protein FMN transferase
LKRILAIAISFVVFIAAERPARASENALSRYEFSEPHMGTLWRITLYAPDAESASNAVRAAFSRVAALEQIMTDYDPDSELMRLSRSPRGTPVAVSDDLYAILSGSLTISAASQGAFDITVGPVVQLWRRARRQRELPDPHRLEVARQSVGYSKVRLDPNRRSVTLLADSMRLDLGGIGKGYGADAALAVLRERGLGRALVAASGDLSIGDAPPGQAGWRVGVGAAGGGATNLVANLLLTHAGVSTSGDAEQFVVLAGRRLSHIIDPRTGQALTNRIQNTVVSRCAMRSDGMAKTVCVLGAEAGLRFIESQPDAEALVQIPEPGGGFRIVRSKGFAVHEVKK